MSTTFGLHRALLFDRNGVATLFEDRKRTWAEVADRVARLAGALKELGVGRGDRVAILMVNQDRYLELYLAIAWAGAVVVPLNIRWNAAENQDCLSDCRPKLLVVDAAFAAMGAVIAKAMASFAVVYGDGAAQARPEGSHDYETLVAAAAPVADAEANAAYVTETCDHLLAIGVRDRDLEWLTARLRSKWRRNRTGCGGMVSKRAGALRSRPFPRAGRATWPPSTPSSR